MRKILAIFVPILIFSGTCQAQTIPNGDFENWQSAIYNELDSGWSSSNAISIASEGIMSATKVTGHVGQAIHLQTSIVGQDTLIGYVTNEPGLPYSQMPTAIKGFYRCNIAKKDTGIIAFLFEKKGSPIFFGSVPFTGNVSTFTPFNYTFSLPSQPDTVIIFIASSNLIDDVGVQAGSWLEIDQLSFTGLGVTQKIPDGGFDNWTTHTFEVPTGWNVSQSGDTSSGVSRSNDSYFGSYSAQLVTLSDSTAAGITTGQFDQFSNSYGGKPYTLITDTISGYYKYTTPGRDTGVLIAFLQNNGNLVGLQGQRFAPAANWTYFELPISATSAPDTLRIDIHSSYASIAQPAFIPGSTLLVDGLQLKSQPLQSGIKNTLGNLFSLNAFPDPASDVLNINLKQPIPLGFRLKLYDVAGQLLVDNSYSANATAVIVPVAKYKPGMYFYQISSSETVYYGRFAKK